MDQFLASLTMGHVCLDLGNNYPGWFLFGKLGYYCENGDTYNSIYIWIGEENSLWIYPIIWCFSLAYYCQVERMACLHYVSMHIQQCSRYVFKYKDRVVVVVVVFAVVAWSL